ncbi:hypothetical protein N7495_005444 [Penicillium taxi]|uniref:uncharacterized protein n=1 Tax=Penicillium taxi TaxID=168475 RepID=UPI002544F10E|nr:uncharacterized protein N7495_005444 [Penicillium taxi]KAJ5893753.1 hypothetical protein N7495_005444 [Penicillium taxi]
MIAWNWLFVTVLALVQQGLCSGGDICYLVGSKSAVVNDQLYFFAGNYSTVSDGAASLYSIELSDQFPAQRAIPQSALSTHSIDSDASVAYNSAMLTRSANSGNVNGAIWNIGDVIYVFGGGFETPNNLVGAYNTSTGEWKDVTVAGGDFNFGNRFSTQFATAPGANLGFVYGGSTPYMTGMIRFDASDPNQLSWTNETLTSGSNGIELPNISGGTLVYIPAGKEGMLISFGGRNATAGLTSKGWHIESDWLIIYVYDISSHTWWMQKASGVPPKNRLSFCTAVTTSPDGGAFHITTYGGWSLEDSRSYEDVYVLTIPSFKWINVTDVSNKTNTEWVNSTIGRDTMSGACQTYKGSQAIVLGGEIRSGAYSVSKRKCSPVFEPVRVLDLSSYIWRSDLSTTSSYEVPAVIFAEIGGNASGGATITTPSAGFADSTLASLLQQRAATNISTSFSSSLSDQNTSHVNSGAIAGGVVGGVAGLALIAGAAWLLFRSRRSQKHSVDSKGPLSPHDNVGAQELESQNMYEAPMHGETETAELDGANVLELSGLLPSVERSPIQNIGLTRI